MIATEKALSPQEQRVEGRLVSPESNLARTRVRRILERIRAKTPRASIERARLYTEALKQTEGLPMVMRFARAFEHTVNNIDISIGDDELIVGHCGPAGRQGIFYPELRACWLDKNIKALQTRKEGPFILTEEDIRVLKEEILPYWRGRTVHQAYISLLPEDTRRLFYEPDNYSTKWVVDDKLTLKHSEKWAPDYEKVLKKGFNRIKKEAEDRLASLDSLNHENSFDKAPFLTAIIIVCDAMVTFAGRYAELARSMAEKETREERKRELLEIAEVCDRVPGDPARTFREAIQSHWFTVVGSHFEAEGYTFGNGRMDQFLYPYYERDVREGKTTQDEALELLECHWLNQAQNLPMILTSSISGWESYPHFEMVTVGGLTREGRDGTNELSYLILQSKQELPLNYPDLMVRVHSRSPQSFLMKACECVKEGTGFPKFLNDEDLVPALLTECSTWEEALDYAGAGCVGAKMPNRDVFRPTGMAVSLPAALDMALNDGVLRSGQERMGISTGDPRAFASFDDLMNAFKLQLKNILSHCFIGFTSIDQVTRERLAAPFHSSLHDLCMQQCQDMFSGKIEGANYGDTTYTAVGFATVVDSLAAVKKLVYDDKTVTMDELLKALDTNFGDKEVLRQMCLEAPKYGNNNSYVDSIGREVEAMIGSLSQAYTGISGGKVGPNYVPVTFHVRLGSMSGATSNGRKAKESLSDGISPSHGCDMNGPTASLLSVANIKNRRNMRDRQPKLLNMKLSPQAVAGDNGTKNLVALLRTWCDLKLWHIQFNIINSETLREAQKYPEKYRNLLVRVAGYSAYFVDLSPAVQEEIIRRTEHQAL